MRVLMVLEHAPDYRERFLRELSSRQGVQLTVIAQPCEDDYLVPPESRFGYDYVELKSTNLLGVRWQAGFNKVLRSGRWDIICVAANLRYLSWLFAFLRYKKYWTRWVWWGHIVGGSTNNYLFALRKFILKNAAGCLVHGKSIVTVLERDYSINALSFNNSEFSMREVHSPHFDDHVGLRLLFVGRNQARKRLSVLIQLCQRRDDVRLRLIGPGMNTLFVPEPLITKGQVVIYDRIVGDQLKSHFDWADLVANPGHVGLLVMNAAKHGKGIVIDSEAKHAPEYYLAKEAGQPFISFDDRAAVDDFIDSVMRDRELLLEYAAALQCRALSEYTVENMATVHVGMFRDIFADTHS